MLGAFGKQRLMDHQPEVNEQRPGHQRKDDDVDKEVLHGKRDHPQQDLDAKGDRQRREQARQQGAAAPPPVVAAQPQRRCDDAGRARVDQHQQESRARQPDGPIETRADERPGEERPELRQRARHGEAEGRSRAEAQPIERLSKTLAEQIEEEWPRQHQGLCDHRDGDPGQDKRGLSVARDEQLRKEAAGRVGECDAEQRADHHRGADDQPWLGLVDLDLVEVVQIEDGHQENRGNRRCPEEVECGQHADQRRARDQCKAK